MATPESFAALLPSIEPLCPTLVADLSAQLALPDTWTETCPRLLHLLTQYTKTHHPTDALAQTLKRLSTMVDSSSPPPNTRKPAKSKLSSRASKHTKPTKTVPDTLTSPKTEREQMLERLFTIIREYNQAHAD
jgi:hypothetical protein